MQLATAEEYVRESLDRARRQEAKILELRSLVSLCLLRRERWSVVEEQDELMKLFGSFSEGLDTPDLRAARGLIEALKG